VYYDPCCESQVYYYPCETNECCDRFWVDAEYLYWKIKDCPEPTPLVFEGSKVLKSDSDVILGGKHIHTDWRSGGKFAVGYWFDDDKCWGGELNYFFLPNKSKRNTVSSDLTTGSPHLRIPYFDVVSGKETSTDLSDPGSFSGTASLKLRNRMQGAELNIVKKLSGFSGISVTALGGFRYWNFNEHLSFTTSSPFINPPIDTFVTKDRFSTENNFYGGQIGVLLAYNWCNFYLTAKGKVALGGMYERLKIDGSLATNDLDNFGDVQTFPGGYFALPTSIGKHKKTRFSVIPEVNVSLGYKLFDCAWLEVGYTFLYVSKVLRVGKQIDPNLNTSQSTTYTNNATPKLKGQASPRALHKTEGLWAQGLNVGVVVQF